MIQPAFLVGSSFPIGGKSSAVPHRILLYDYGRASWQPIGVVGRSRVVVGAPAYHGQGGV
jgi:hypothetical protein